MQRTDRDGYTEPTEQVSYAAVHWQHEVRRSAFTGVVVDRGRIPISTFLTTNAQSRTYPYSTRETTDLIKYSISHSSRSKRCRVGRAISVGWRERLYLHEPEACATRSPERLGEIQRHARIVGSYFQNASGVESGVAYHKAGQPGGCPMIASALCWKR
jgi:hypothetical protein